MTEGTHHPDLTELAHAYGVATEYWSQSGEYVTVRRETISAVLRSLGAEPTTDEGVAQSLIDIRNRDWRRILPPVFVTVAGEAKDLWVHVPHGESVTVIIALENGGTVELQQTDRWVEPREIDDALIGEATFCVPAHLPLGWHVAEADISGVVTQMPLVVTPAALDPAALQGHDRLLGLMAQIYSVRSKRSWGMGDIGDLADLVTWSARHLDADFCAINPLHASAPTEPITPSPYLPSTRRFANPIYLRVEDVPEYAYLGGKERKRIRQLARRFDPLDPSLIDRDAVWRAKRAALEILRGVLLSPGRLAAYDAFVDREGSGLVDICTWNAIAEERGPKWRVWPKELQHPGDPAVARWRAEHPHEVQFHLWMQWLLDEQLAAAQDSAERAGMRIGIIHDLAVGVTFDGADAWALQDVLAQGVSVGAPPDMYNQKGQNWAQPPWRPVALAEAGFAPFRDLLRTTLRHAGGLRIDHILGLFRMWWIPDGMEAFDGTYVTFDHDALVGILVLEAHRADSIVIGEDLGTVEPWVQEFLQGRGILGTSILWFERWPGGAIKQPEEWRSDVLASVTVHDLPPTAGYLAGEHVRIRGELGLLNHSVATELQIAEVERAEWVQMLRDRGWLTGEDVDGIVAALHRFVAASPARLIGVALPDLVGDVRAQNQPGTDQEYPNWRVPLADRTQQPVPLERMVEAPLLEAVRASLRAQG